MTGDSFIKMLDGEVFPSILNENNEFPLLSALSVMQIMLSSLEDKIVRIIVMWWHGELQMI